MPTKPTLDGENARLLASALSNYSKAVQETLFCILEETFEGKRNWEAVLRRIVPALRDNAVVMEITQALKNGNVLEAMDIVESLQRRSK